MAKSSATRHQPEQAPNHKHLLIGSIAATTFIAAVLSWSNEPTTETEGKAEKPSQIANIFKIWKNSVRIPNNATRNSAPETPPSAGTVKPMDAFISASGKKPEKLLYNVPPDVDKVFRRITKNDPISYELMVNLLGSESGLKKTARSKTGALGIGQFTERTFIERAYKDKELLPLKYRALLNTIIQRRNSKDEHYYVFSGKTQEEKDKNREKVLALRGDLEAGSITAREHIRTMLIDAEKRYRTGIDAKIRHITSTYPVQPLERLAKLREERNRPLTIADAKIVYVSGAQGGAQILLAAADIATANHRISDYTPPVVALNNPELFSYNGKNANPSQFLSYINERVGNMEIANDLRRSATAQHVSKVTLDIS